MGFWFTGMGIAQWLDLNLTKLAMKSLINENLHILASYKHSFLIFAYMALGGMIVLIIAKLIDSICLKKMAKR